MSVKSNPHILDRFQGRTGKKRLVAAFRNQELVAGNMEAAKALARFATIHSFKIGDVLIKQGKSDTEIYFILGGVVTVEVNSRIVASRNAGEHVGEMALLDTTAVRSATIRAKEKTIVAKVDEVKFTRIANQYPELWRKIAVVISKRLSERNKYHALPRSEPVVFIGSSSEGLNVAEIIDKELKKVAITQLWTADDTFQLSKTTIEDLMRVAKEIDFAVLVLSPDDITISRSKVNNSPRDNVIFELGLFMGALSRERAFIVMPDKKLVKRPSDLEGINCSLYKCQKGTSLKRNLNSCIKRLITHIKNLGPI